ncbi:MAG: cyclase family protein [Candidatus Brocadiia bacterium]
MAGSPLRVFDLAQPLFDGCPAMPGTPRVRLRAVRTVDRDGYALETLRVTTHSGTHVDAPGHLLHGERGAISDFRPDHFIGPCLLADLTAKEDDDEITAEDLEAYRGRLEPGDILVLATGWSRFRGEDEDRWRNHSPYLTAEGAEWLCARGLKGVGIDHYTIGTSLERFDRPPHEILLRRRIWIAEDLVVPPELLGEPRKWLYVGVPLNIEGASGAPVRPVLLDVEAGPAPGEAPGPQT